MRATAPPTNTARVTQSNGEAPLANNTDTARPKLEPTRYASPVDECAVIECPRSSLKNKASCYQI